MNAIAQPTPAAEIEPTTDEFPLLGYTVIASLSAG
jgi:hypothetical protein